MSNKLSDTNDDRFKSLGFESTFDGSAGGIQWSELVEDLKTNVLRQNLRVRKLILGEYTTTVAGKAMAKVPVDAEAWTVPTRGRLSLRRERGLIVSKNFPRNSFAKRSWLNTIRMYAGC